MQSRRNRFERVLVDLNTQCDFLLPRGSVPVANREEMLPNVRKIMNWARIERLPVVSTIDAHRECERRNGMPAYCVDRTPGQKKLPFTLLPRRIVIPGDNTLDLPIDPLRRHRQLIFTKRASDFLTNPKADRLINHIDVGHFVVFGVITEACVKSAVLALIARLRRVVVVADACGCWSPPDADLALRQMEAKGAYLTTTEQIISGAAEEDIRRLELDGVEPDNRVGAGNGASKIIGGLVRVHARRNGNGSAGKNGRSNEPATRPLDHDDPHSPQTAAAEPDTSNSSEVSRTARGVEAAPEPDLGAPSIKQAGSERQFGRDLA